MSFDNIVLRRRDILRLTTFIVEFRFGEHLLAHLRTDRAKRKSMESRSRLVADPSDLLLDPASEC